MSLEKIAEISRKMGANPEYVLAGGGNTSWKKDGILYVKPSGKMLADAFESGRSCSDIQRRYKESTRGLKCKLLLKSVKRFFLCNPFTRWIIMKSGVQSISPYAKNDKKFQN